MNKQKWTNKNEKKKKSRSWCVLNFVMLLFFLYRIIRRNCVNFMDEKKNGSEKNVRMHINLILLNSTEVNRIKCGK